MIFGALPGIAQIRYFQPATVAGVPGQVKPIPSTVQDSIITDTIFQVMSKEGYPLHYYKKIRTSVCFDNKCRLLKCTLYWNIMGRYLGFELEKGEYLSKARHKPFKRKEYERLNKILADESSPLRALSYDELAPRPKTAADEVDGVTSATSKNILEEVVPGAAYTTYKMWHVVYGETQEEVQNLTLETLTADLALHILDSPDRGDRVWALNHLRGRVKLGTPLRERILSLIGTGPYNLTERAINALNGTELRSDTVQTLLTGKLMQGSYAIKKLIIAKLTEAPSLAAPTVDSLTTILTGTHPELTSNILDLFTRHHIADTATCRQVATLLGSPNAFVARKAYKYLAGIKISDPTVLREISKYEQHEPDSAH